MRAISGTAVLLVALLVLLGGSAFAQVGPTAVGVPVERGGWRFVALEHERRAALRGPAEEPPGWAFTDLAQRTSEGAEFAILATGGAARVTAAADLAPQGEFLVVTFEATNRDGVLRILDLRDVGLKPADRPHEPWLPARYLGSDGRWTWRVTFEPGATKRFSAAFDVAQPVAQSAAVAWLRLRGASASALPRTGGPPLLPLALLLLGLGAVLWCVGRGAPQRLHV